MSSLKRTTLATAVLVAFLAGGCDSFVYYRADIPQTTSAARLALENLAANPRPLHRKLVLIHGWRGEARQWDELVEWLRRCTTNAEDMITVVKHAGDIHIPFLTEWIMEEYNISGDVDVVGHSMGGLIAREANRKGMIRIRTLYSMASPHKGSYLARYGPWYKQLREMKPGSDFLNDLNSDPRSKDFRVITYWMKGDSLLRQKSSESLGGTNIIMSPSRKPLLRWTHDHLLMDERTIFDVVRRLTYPPQVALGAPATPIAGKTTGRYSEPNPGRLIVEVKPPTEVVRTSYEGDSK